MILLGVWYRVKYESIFQKIKSDRTKFVLNENRRNLPCVTLLSESSIRFRNIFLVSAGTRHKSLCKMTNLVKKFNKKVIVHLNLIKRVLSTYAIQLYLLNDKDPYTTNIFILFEIYCVLVSFIRYQTKILLRLSCFLRFVNFLVLYQ